MNKLLFINVFVLCSSFIIIFAFDDGTDFQMGNYKLSQDDELLSNIYDQFGASYEQFATNNFYAEECNPSDSEEFSILASQELEANSDEGQIIHEEYRTLAKKLIDHVPGPKGGRGRDAKSLTDFISLVLWKFDNDIASLEIDNWRSIYVRFYNWWAKSWWQKMYNGFSNNVDLSSEEDRKLLFLLNKIVNYEKQIVQRKPQANEALDCDETNEAFDCDETNEEDLYDANNYMMAKYETLAKKLTKFVPGKRYKGRTDEDITYLISKILYKFENDIAWSEVFSVNSTFYYWHTNGNWQKLYDEFSQNCDQTSQEDQNLLRLLERILDHAESWLLRTKRKFKNRNDVNGALLI